MRTWLVVGALMVMVAGTVALRTRGGWSATSREVLDISCDRRSAEHCTDLGIDLLLGQHGAVDEERGMGMLERGCQLGSGRGCYWRGFQALERKVVGARQIALASFEAGCRVRYFDACAYGGWLKRQGSIAERDLAGGLTELTHACGNGSALGCTFLGELALEGYPSAGERLASARSYEHGCELGNDFGCLRAAQSFACGRGGVVRHDEALELVTSLCAKGMDEACEQRLVLEHADAGLDVDNPALERAVLRATFAAAQRDNRAGAIKGANALDGGVGTLARAALAITFDRLDEADVLLRELSVDGGHPEVEVARQTLAVRREGRPFPDAAWLGWARAGRPDLRRAQWLPSVRDLGDPGACNPAPPVPPLNTTNDFLRAVALSPTRSRLDAPFDPAILRAATRFSVGADQPAKLLALTVLARASRDDSELATREFEASARQALVAEQHDTLFFSLLQTPSDLRTGSASEADLVALEQAVTLPAKQPRRELFDAFMRSLGDHPGAEEAAFAATVFVIIDLFDVLHLPGWLERGGHPAPRRAKVLRQLGEALANTDWLVDGYYGLQLQRSSNRLVEDATLTAQIAKLEQRLSDVRTGPLGVQALGEWPWTPQPNAEAVLEREITSLERLKALSEPPR